MADVRILPILASAFLTFTTYNLFYVSNAFDYEVTCYTKNVSKIMVPYENKPIVLLNATICEPHEHRNNNRCTRTLRKNVLIDRCENNAAETKTRFVFPNNMKTLYLRNISLDVVDQYAFENVSIYYELEELFLSNNRLVNLQEGNFRGLYHLEKLDMVFNSLSTLHLGTFDGLESLTSLYLFGNILEQLPTDIFRGLSKLRILNLKDNRLTKIYPGTLNDLTALRIFNLDLNRLTDVPADLFAMSKMLEEFDLDDNFIVTVPMTLFDGLTNMIELDLDHNKIEQLQPHLFQDLVSLEELELDENNFVELPAGLFHGLSKLKALTLSYNRLSELHPQLFMNLTTLVELHLQYNDLITLDPHIFTDIFNLETLYINHNRLSVLHPDVFRPLIHLKVLSLAENQISQIDTYLFQDIQALTILNISRNNLNTLEPGVFQNIHSLVILDLTYNPLSWVNDEPFQDLKKVTTLYVDNYATCCFVHEARCSFESPPSPFLSCERLLPYSILRVVIWIVGIGSICGNIFVLYTRCRQRSSRGKVQFFLITNLSVSDLIMGVYLIILVVVDLRYTDYFPSHSEMWRRSGLCRFSGALSILSSETSVFFITFISFDRFMGVKFPFVRNRLGRKSVNIAASILWLVSLLISIASVLIPFVSPNLYDASEICVGLPISRINTYDVIERTFKLNTSDLETDLEFGKAVEAVFLGSKVSMYFSIAIFTVLNFLCFSFVAFCYIGIFIIAKRTSRSAGRSSDIDNEMRMAFKMAAVVFSDFCCWMVVVVLSVLVQSGVVTINPVAYAWIATFILPINSCLNPFLYTISSLISDRSQRIRFQNQNTDSVLTSVGSISKAVGGNTKTGM